MAGEWGLAQTQSDEALGAAAEFPSVTASALHFAGVLALGRDEIEVAHSRFDAAAQVLTRVPNNAPPFFLLPCRWGGRSMSVGIRRFLFSRRLCCSVVGLVRNRQLDT